MLFLAPRYNGKAILVEGQFGCVDLEHLVVTNRYTPTDFEDIGAGALGSSGTDYSGTISGSAGITSFVWRSARPFHPVRLHNLICTLNEASVIRMKVRYTPHTLTLLPAQTRRIRCV